MEKMRNALENLKTSFKSGNSRKTIIQKILSLIVAFCIWFYVVSVESPVIEKTVTDIPIEIMLPEDADIKTFSEYKETVDVTVRGKRSALRVLDADDFNAVMDASDYVEAGEYSIRVDIKTPSSATLVDQSVSELKLFLDSNTSKSVDVEVVPIHAPRETDVELVCKSDPSQVLISGPESVVSSIVKARVEFDCNYAVKAEMHDNLNVFLYSKDGDVVESPYLKYDANVYVSVTPYITKSLDLRLNITDLEDTEYSYILKSDGNEITSVKVRGPLELLDSKDEIVIKSSYMENFVIDIALEDGVELLDNIPEELKVQVELNYTEQTFIDVPITVNKPDDLVCELNDIAKDVTVRYIPSKTGELTAEDISLTLSLKSSSVSGRYTPEIEIKGKGVTDNFCLVDEIAVDVVIGQ